MNKESIKGMLNDLKHEIAIETVTGNTAEFINSLNKQFVETGNLSDKQIKVLCKIYTSKIR